MGNEVSAQKFRRGQRVKTKYGISELKVLQKGHGGWADQMSKVVGRVGTVLNIDDDGDVVVDYPTAGQFCFNPISLQPTQESVRVPRTPTAIRAGDLLYVSADKAEVKRLQEDHGGWVDPMATCLGKIGYVKMKFPTGDLRMRIGKTSWTLNPRCTLEISREELLALKSENEDDTDFNAGDIVQVISNESRVKSLQSGHGDWVNPMREQLGKIGYVKNLFRDGDLRVRFAGACWTMNPMAVAKVAPCQTGSGDAISGLGELGGLLALLGALGGLSGTEVDKELFEAVKNNNASKVVERLRRGTDVDQQLNGHTAIQIASHLGHTAAMRVLIDNNADLTLKDNDGDYAIHDAAFADKSEAVRMLLAAGADPNVKNNKGQTPLHIAAQRGFLTTGDVLVAKGAYVNNQDNVGDCSIHDAIHGGHASFVQLLIINGADLNLKNSKGFLPFHLAAIKGDPGCLRCIVDHYKKKNQKFRVDEKKEDGFTALHLAALNNHLECARLLIEDGGAEKDLLNHKHQTPLYLATIQLHTDVASYLVKAGCDPNIPDSDGDTPLHEALRRQAMCASDQLRQVLAVLQTSLNSGDPEAAEKIAMCLVENGADPSIRNHKGQEAMELCQNDAVKRKILNASSAYSSRNPRKTAQFRPVSARKLPTSQLQKEERQHGSGNYGSGSKDFEGDKNSELKRLQGKVESMKKGIVCPVCQDNDRNIIFSCGHGCCQGCSPKLTNCPICRVDIVQRIVTY